MRKIENMTTFKLFAVPLVATLLFAAGANVQSRSNDSEDDKQALRGSFLVTVHVNETGRTFKALDTFVPGGGLIVNFFGPDGIRNVNQGAWRRTGDQEFTLTFEGISPDVKLPSGERVSFVAIKDREKITLDESGDSFIGEFKGSGLDPSGKVVRTFSGTTKGERIVVEPFD